MNRRKFVELSAFAPLLACSNGSKDGPTAEPFVVLPENARVYDTGHGETRILVSGKQSGGAWWLGSFLSEPGRKTSLHVHFKADEQFYVLEGVLSVWLGERWQDLPAGALAVAPRGVPHALGNRSQLPVRFLVSGEPAGFELFFADLELVAHQFSYGSPTFLAELAKVHQKYDSQLIAPPPPG